MISPALSAIRTLAILTLLTLMAACASGPPKPQVDYKPGYNFDAVKKVAFYSDSGQVTGDNPLQLSDIQHDRVDQALAFALKNNGFIMVDDAGQADILLSWHLVTQHKTDVRTYQTPTYGAGYGGYGRYNRYSAYNCWSCAPSRTEVSVQDYTQGTFIVDMIDPTLKKSIWRGVTQSRLKGKPVQDQGKYNAAATAIFADFPPL